MLALLLQLRIQPYQLGRQASFKLTFDRDVENRRGALQFEPWVGEKYRSEGLRGVRVLALGESHYAEPGFASRTFTSDVVRECVFEGRAAYFTKVAKLMTGLGSGEYLTDGLLQDTWSRIAFYNFVQQMLPAPRVRPTEAMWKQARQLFPSIVLQLQPQLIVVMGKHLREWFESPQGVEVCFTEHPSSSRFSYQPWSDHFQTAHARVLANTGS